MKFLITDYFFKSIPYEKNNKVLNRLYYFYNTIKQNKLLSFDLPKGFWIKKIKGTTSLFEFRVDSGDRIFFLLNNFSREINGNIIFLLFSSHDNAIKKAKRKELQTSNLKEFITFDSQDNIETLDEDYFNWNNLITYEMLDDEDFSKNFHNKKFKYYYLNDEQFNCLSDLPPYFVAGSAGSGKSTLTLRKLLNLEENRSIYNYSQVLYLTANQYLKDNSFDQYLEFRNNSSPNIGVFYTLKSFFSQHLEISQNSIVGFKEFHSFLNFSYPNRKKLGISEEEIYSEINGIIKGIMVKGIADNWNRDTSKSTIELDDYLNLSLKYSILNTENRIAVYQICQNYNQWLKNNNFFDLNDLARLALNIELSFDFIIIDEIQDLTELQIFSLISFAKSKDSVFLAGDIHQMVNSTFFNFERIRNLFYSKFKKNINIKILSKNYRSGKKIVDLANYFSTLRATYIGNLGIDDYKEISIHKDGEVNLTQIDLTLIENAQNDVTYAIVVPDETVKNNLLDKLKNKHRIFTIQEIKGLEYNNIICYNLSSAYQMQWNKIFSKEAKHDQRYRKYFNMFYVGITRAQEKLIIMEENINSNIILKELHDFLTPNNNIVIDKKVQSSKKEKSEWLKEGIKLFKLEKIEEAKYAFEKAGEPTWILEREIEKDISAFLFKNAIKKINSTNLKGKQNYYKKLIIDTSIENSLFLDAVECNKKFGISYKEKEIKEGIKIGIEDNIFTPKELQKILNFFREKKDSNFVGDLLLKMNKFNDALLIFQSLNNETGIRTARMGLLSENFGNLPNFKDKILELEDIILGKNINSFGKKDKLTPLHRALILKEDPVLFDMILMLGGNLTSFIKGKDLVPLYCLGNMKMSREKTDEFIKIFLRCNFNFDNPLYIAVFLNNPGAFKILAKAKHFKTDTIPNIIANFLNNQGDEPNLLDISSRKFKLFKNILKNYKD
ncbi:UvrD-helicase domain-containing protein [uncultured Cetobacterium sp.]|uniref:UvrD-helicase domain-containing protein n=1 Tax=uncultured Cetobacterium sp. TaxID=527638 RepID=UPI002614EDBB|nr:UvrD-helicase domain-containing protein [uncultured Cetobacterium sp.]